MNEPTQDTMSNDSENMMPAPMPLYTCHKQVRAARIVRTELLPQHQPSLVCLEFAGDVGPNAVLVSDDWLVRRTDTETVDAALTKAVGGYFIQYDNGYTSWSPAEAFEAGYHLGDGIVALLAVALDRLECFQSSEYQCQENKMAQFHLTRALEELHARTRRRIARGVEGTHEV